MTSQRSDLGRITLSVLFIGGLIAGSLWILETIPASLRLGHDDRGGDTDRRCGSLEGMVSAGAGRRRSS